MVNKMGKLNILLIIALLSVSMVYAHAGDNFSDTKNLIDSNVSCNELSDDQLEEIGDYYMEQMHPGESHKLMDNMMGGEGSKSLKQVHINMAKTIYCGETNYRYGMMGGMMNMMNFGMMGGYDGYGMMGSSFFGISSILGFLFLLGLVVLVWLWVYKLWRDIQRRQK